MERVKWLRWKRLVKKVSFQARVIEWRNGGWHRRWTEMRVWGESEGWVLGGSRKDSRGHSNITSHAEGSGEAAVWHEGGVVRLSVTSHSQHFYLLTAFTMLNKPAWDVSETLGFDTETLFSDLLACVTMASFSMFYEFMNSRYRVVQSSLSMCHVNTCNSWCSLVSK